MGNNDSRQFIDRFYHFSFMTALVVDSVRKAFGNRNILNDVYVSCKQGEIVGIMGPNGSGKSSLLKIIFGCAPADNKYVAIDAKKTSSLYASRNLIHYLPQHGFLPSHIRIRDVISCFCRKENAEVLMKSEFILPFLDKKTKQLSGGERRIVEILMLLHATAKILLLDEPFHSISPIYIEKIKSLIQLHAKNKAIVITDHSYQNVIDISSRIVLIQQGNTREIKELTELFQFGYLPESLRGNMLNEIR